MWLPYMSIWGLVPPDDVYIYVVVVIALRISFILFLFLVFCQEVPGKATILILYYVFIHKSKRLRGLSQRFHKNGLRFIRCPTHQPTSSPWRVGKVKAVIQGPALLALSRRLCLHWIPVNFEKQFSEGDFLDLVSFRWSFDRLIGLRPFKEIKNTRKTEISKMPTVMQIAAWMVSKSNFKKYMGKG